MSKVNLAEALEATKPTAPRVLTIDIETSPATVRTYGLFNQNIGITQIVEPTRMLCFAGKWLDESKVHYFSEFHDGTATMIKSAWHMMNDADVIVSYNGPGFDIKHLHREFLLAGMPPPSPHQDIDLLRVMRARFKFMSNKLAYVTTALGMETKLDTGGQALWNAVLDGNPKAWAKFRRYNKQDVVITENLLRLLGPWIKGPHAGTFADNMAGCHSCGSTAMVPAGLVHTKTTTYPQARCACGAWNRILKNGETRPA